MKGYLLKGKIKKTNHCAVIILVTADSGSSIIYIGKLQMFSAFYFLTPPKGPEFSVAEFLS